MRLFFIVCFSDLFIPLFSFAQLQSNNWYFGDSSGISFHNGKPIILTDGAMNTLEGCATISDSLGNLLFYTNGIEVWNQKHKIMPNGAGLFGHQSSTQSAIIVPNPSDKNIYYIFTVDAEAGKRGLCMSEVNMKLNNGLGDISKKNAKLIAPVVEKITAVKHKNNRDIWVITHQWQTDSFYTYLVTKAGLNLAPVISKIGTRHDDKTGLGNTLGCLKVSPKGDKLSCVRSADAICELFDFDNESGEISNPRFMPGNLNWPYGTEFSPNGKRLYVSCVDRIYQFDLDKQDKIPVAIIAESTKEQFCTMQLSTDGKIYIAQHPPHNPIYFPSSPYLSVIERPNEIGLTCKFKFNSLFLNGNGSQLGLPTFIQSYFSAPTFYANNRCFGDSTLFFFDSDLKFDSVHWSFGDTPSGIKNYSKEREPVHIFSKYGKYTVSLIGYSNFTSDTLKSVVQINPSPLIELGKDKLVCNLKEIKLAARYTDTISKYFQNPAGQNFLWNDKKSIDSIFVARNPGLYSVIVTNRLGCQASDSIRIYFGESTKFDLGTDKIICEHDSLVIDPKLTEVEFLWQNGSDKSRLTAYSGGKYWLTITNQSGCTSADTLNITQLRKPFINLGKDTFPCNGSQILLNVESPYANYLWQDGSKLSQITINRTGLYWVKVSNQCGTDTDSIETEYKFCDRTMDVPTAVTSKTQNFIITGILPMEDAPDEKWEFYVYNRWGNLIYSSKDYRGYWKPEKLTDAVYYYLLIYQPENIVKKGFFYYFEEN